MSEWLQQTSPGDLCWIVIFGIVIIIVMVKSL